jgi:hypothetical protein
MTLQLDREEPEADRDAAAWMAEEIPFNTAQRTWERADLIVCGTPQIPYDAATEIVVAGNRRP